MDKDNENLAKEVPERVCGTYLLRDWLDKVSDKERAAFDAGLAALGFKPSPRIQNLEALMSREKKLAYRQSSQ